jgi:hypothetical protein
MSTFHSFARRLREDLTFDSICTRCYQTIATAPRSIDLAKIEQSHVCDPDGEHTRFSQAHMDSQRGTI